MVVLLSAVGATHQTVTTPPQAEQTTTTQVPKSSTTTTAPDTAATNTPVLGDAPARAMGLIYKSLAQKSIGLAVLNATNGQPHLVMASAVALGTAIANVLSIQAANQ